MELGCGTGRILLPVARAGFAVTGIDLSAQMLDFCRERLEAEPPEVRERVRLIEWDMTSFELDHAPAAIICAFNSFHHLRTVQEQLECLERCHAALPPDGMLVLDLVNPDPAPSEAQSAALSDRDTSADIVQWTEGRTIRRWMSECTYDRMMQCNECEMTYEITEPDGTTRRLAETFPLRFLYRYEMVHLLARCGFRIVALYGDYDRSPFSDESLGMIVVAVPRAGRQSA